MEEHTRGRGRFNFSKLAERTLKPSPAREKLLAKYSGTFLLSGRCAATWLEKEEREPKCLQWKGEELLQRGAELKICLVCEGRTGKKWIETLSVLKRTWACKVNRPGGHWTELCRKATDVKKAYWGAKWKECSVKYWAIEIDIGDVGVSWK